MPRTTGGNNWVNVKPITHVISFKPTQCHEVSTGVTSISFCKDETQTHKQLIQGLATKSGRWRLPLSDFLWFL